MTVIALKSDLLSRVRAETAVAGRQAIVIALEARDDLAEQRAVAAALGISERQMAKARRVVREEISMAHEVRAGQMSLEAAEALLSDRSIARSAGSDVLDRIARQVATTSSQPARRALELATIERDEKLTPRDVGILARRLGVNNTAVRRARLALAAGHAPAIRAGTRSLTDSTGGSVSNVETPVRVDTAWVGRELSKKLTMALETLSELPLPADVADLLKEHSSISADQLDRAINWLEDLRRAF